MADLEAPVPVDLQTYLGADAIDEERAWLLIDLAVALCSAIVSPLPQSALAVVLSSAARAYSNPQGITSEMVGPYQTSRPSAGVYLTKSERTALRTLTGGGGAFNIDMLSAGYPDDRFPTT